MSSAGRASQPQLPPLSSNLAAAVQPNAGYQRRQSSMAATATNMAPPKWGHPGRFAAITIEPLYREPAELAPEEGSVWNGPAVTSIDVSSSRFGAGAAQAATAPESTGNDYSGMVEGTVRHVTFRATDTGFTVLKVEVNRQHGAPANDSSVQPPARSRAWQTANGKRQRQRKPDEGVTTVIGQFQQLSKGQLLRFEGHWVEHSTFGSQLQALR